MQHDNSDEVWGTAAPLFRDSTSASPTFFNLH
jgi:hypothetical protein